MSIIDLPKSAQMLEKWLRDIGCDPKRGADPEMNWQFEVDYPPGTPHRIGVFNQKAKPRALVVVAQASFAPEHHEAFQELEQDEKSNFLVELQTTLNREYVEYALLGVNETPSCPTAFQVTATRYDDGLSLDSIARSISSVYKAELAAILCVQRHLSPRGLGGAGQFEFKRTGVQ